MFKNYKLEGDILIEGFDAELAEASRRKKDDENSKYWQIVTESRQNHSILQTEVFGFEEVKYHAEKEAEWCALIKIGDVKGYIPLSMLDSDERRMRGLINQKVVFVVTAINNKNNNEYFVGSRKQAIKTMSDRAIKRLQIGDVVTGVIRKVFIANMMVDIGGIVTQIPVSEVSHSWVDNLKSLYDTGQHVDVKITAINRDTRVVQASIKALLPDPFDTNIDDYKEGGEYIGFVSGVRQYGYYINFQDGISGLAPLRNFPLNVGDKVLCRFGKVDKEKRQINLRIVKAV